jgi:hypothetical protein
MGLFFAMGALLLSAFAAPVSAAGAVRWVDNDSTPGDGPNKCDNAPYHTIQAAINNSNPYDTIYVCPGTYRQALTVDVKGLHIESVNYRKAKLMPPTTYPGFPALVSIQAREVDFWNFLMPIPGGPLDLNVNASSAGGGGVGPSCQSTLAAIEVLGPAADIRGNYIKGTGDFTYSGDCGYLYGIVLASQVAQGVNPDVTGANVSSVSHNRILDFKYLGILAEGDVQARIVRNAVRYIHEDDPATCVLTPVLGVNEEIAFPCQFETMLPTGNVNGAFSEAIGIGAEFGAEVEIRANTVYSTFDISTSNLPLAQTGIPSPGAESSIFLAGGISLMGASPDSTVRNNTVSNTGFAVSVFGNELVPAEPDDNPDGVTVTGNRVHDSFFGFLVVADDGVYYGNRARTNVAGAYVPQGENNLFHANDFRFNLDIDCLDQTTGSGDAGTANWWTNETEDRYNLGENDSPDGICIPTFIF